MAISLFVIFFKMGLFSFGGGNAMMGVFERILVTERQYLTSAQFADMIAISQITPGPFAVNIATYTGAALGTTPYESIFLSTVATIGISLPAFIYIVLIAKFFKEFGDSKAVKSVMGGIKPGVIGLMLASVIIIGGLSVYNKDAIAANNLSGAINYGAALIAAGVFAVSRKTKINPLTVLIASGIIGIFIL